MSSALKYWHNGLPITETATPSTLGLKYWFNGLPLVVPDGGAAPPDTITVFTVEHGQGYNKIEIVGY